MQFKIIVIYILSYFLSIFIGKKYENVWLISERGDEAKDNGYAFYQYLKKNHSEIILKYVITKKSCDIQKIDNEDIVYFGSLKHYMYFINAKCLISTHLMGYSPELGMFRTLDRFNLVFVKGKRIFLQHGVIYNYLLPLINQKIDLFITSSEIEKNYVIDYFGYSEKNVKCTGLARFDYLNEQKENFILVMPTWRSNLYYVNDNMFKNSEYYKNWVDFLNSKELVKLLEYYNLKLIFYPHYEIQKRINLFSFNN